MCRLFHCLPIFRGGIIKKCKKMCMYGGFKNCNVTCENFVYQCVGGYKQIIALGIPKTHYSGGVFPSTGEYVKAYRK